MYVHSAFKASVDDAKALLADRGFGAVVAHDGEFPLVSHVPFLHLPDPAPLGTIAFHVARPNKLHEVFARHPRGLVICQGPDGYISPDWYESANQVPTWNFVTVHATGSVRVLDRSRTRAHVEALSAHFEAKLAPKKPWTTDKMEPHRLSAMLEAIVALDMTVERIEASWKLGQNKAPADRAGAVAGLKALKGEPQALLLAALMEERLDG